MKTHIPVYLGIHGACKMFDVSEKQVYQWIRNKELRYVVLNPGENAKRRLYVNDILRLMEKNQYGGENIPEAER